jgi:2-methylcitrate dehydratase PrpD
MVGYEVITQTSRICLGPRGPELGNHGWFNQGFQPALGVAALAAKLMKRVVRTPLHGDLGKVKLGSTVILKLKNGEILEETVNQAHGTPADPLSWQEITDKFHECAAAVPLAQRKQVIELCAQLETISSLREVAEAVGLA